MLEQTLNLTEADGEPVQPDEFARRIAQTRAAYAMLFVPQTDGNVTWFPGKIFGNGYVLSPAQAREWFEHCARTSFGLAKIFCLIGILIVFSTGGVLLLPEKYDTLFVSGLNLAVVGGILAKPFFAERRFLSRYPDAPRSRFGFLRNDYRRLREMLLPLYSAVATFVGFTFFYLISLPLLILGTVLLFGASYRPLIGACLILFAAGLVSMSYAYFVVFLRHWRFRKINGRKPNRDDLMPVEPETGKMVPDPFTTQIQVGRE